MHAIISTLDEVNNSRVIHLWRLLADNCNLRGIFRIPLPHFSWHGAESYHLHLLEPLLEDWAPGTEPLQVRTSGMGIFTGEKPIIHLRLIATKRLADYHNQILQLVQRTGVRGPSVFYDPDSWLPHITLGIEDVNSSNIGCAVEQLAFQPYDWVIQIDNLCIVSFEPDEPDQNGEIIRQFRLGSGNGS